MVNVKIADINVLDKIYIRENSNPWVVAEIRNEFTIEDIPFRVITCEEITKPFVGENDLVYEGVLKHTIEKPLTDEIEVFKIERN